MDRVKRFNSVFWILTLLSILTIIYIYLFQFEAKIATEQKIDTAFLMDIQENKDGYYKVNQIIQVDDDFYMTIKDCDFDYKEDRALNNIMPNQKVLKINMLFENLSQDIKVIGDFVFKDSNNNYISKYYSIENCVSSQMSPICNFESYVCCVYDDTTNGIVVTYRTPLGKCFNIDLDFPEE